jgi:ATP-dependent DNA helicase RecG
MTALTLDTEIKNLYMIGPAYAQRLRKLKIETVKDLLYHIPFRYQDYSLISKISELQPGETATIQTRILDMKNQYTKYGKKIQKAQVIDNTGQLEILWFNQPFLVKNIRPNSLVNFSGKVKLSGTKLQMVSPQYEVLSQYSHDLQRPTLHTGRLVPIYPETYKLSSKWLRSRIGSLLPKILPQIKEHLPKKIIKSNGLRSLKESLAEVHFPQSLNAAQEAKERLAFDELFLLHLTNLKRKQKWNKKKVNVELEIKKFTPQLKKFVSSLPFELTNAQKKALREILEDLEKPKPMNRLLEGDVGSGKTVVAAATMFIVFLNGLQSVLMAPTEILATQHYHTLYQFLEPFGIKIKLLTSSKEKVSKNTLLPSDITVGTHALIHKKAHFQELGLVIIDEQHRFGVKQRARLAQKGKSPHILTMTATPIPRSIALTLYGNLNLSFLDEMPKGKASTKTWVVPRVKREKAYQCIKNQIKEHKVQCFIVCPLIEESQKETMKSVKAATVEFKKLKKIFSPLKLGLLHGRLKSKNKDKVLDLFREGKIHILVCTPIVEVGIDIKNATIMVVEGADRFGLAQLHQLRGRVGRGKKTSYCLLFTESRSHTVHQRLRAMEKSLSGAELAELDLKLRGPGELFGTAQHGFFALQIATFSNFGLIKKTRLEAESLLKKDPTFKKYPLLKEKIKTILKKPIQPN